MTFDKTKIKHSGRDSNLESLLYSEHIVNIEKLVVGGAGLARLQYQERSLVVFIPLAATADKLKIKITSIEKNHLIGEITEIITPSPSRREPPCEYFKSCGGCSWQHIEETEQVRQKEQILVDLLSKNIPDVSFNLLPTIVSEKNFNYRNRIQLKQKGTDLGYFKKASHQIVDISSCLIAQVEISEQIPVIKKILDPTNELKKFELRINHLNQFEYYLIGEDAEGLSFSQVNSAINKKLVQKIVELVKAVNPKFLTELYGGAGNFSFPLLSEISNVCIESVEMNFKLTTFATKELIKQRLQKRFFMFTTDCESFVERRALSKEFILLDPPRMGCSEKVLNKIIAANSEYLLYVSCHPAFLVRDLKKILKARPSYIIKTLQIFDMFPQTDHFETLVLLSQNQAVDDAFSPVNN